MRHAALVLGIWLGGAAAAQETGAPLSAIDWLSQSVDTAAAAEASEATAEEPAVADSAAAPEVRVLPLDAPTPDAIGLLAGDVTGLPEDLWLGSDPESLALLIAAQDAEALPAITGLLTTLLLAETAPMPGTGPEAPLFFARVDKLLDLGALDVAEAMLRKADPQDPEVFRRRFDVALLTGTEDAACDVLAQAPDVAPSLLARIFCLARAGDWPAAALTLDTARALGDVSDADDLLMARFLDPELADDSPLPRPDPVTPLRYRMLEAIGEAIPTTGLPRAFAHADLRDTAGWRAQLDAAERLIRVGGIADNAFLGLYTARRPAASGAVWDRVAAIQALDDALSRRNVADVAATLPGAQEAMAAVRAEAAFARLVYPRLRGLQLSPQATTLTHRLGLLTEDYQEAGAALPATSAEAIFLAALARGAPQSIPAPDPRAGAIQAAWREDSPTALMEMADDGRLGEAILRAIADFNAGARGDPADMTDPLRLFRHVGLEDLARRAALQALILRR